jgi:hypothetical protein
MPCPIPKEIFDVIKHAKVLYAMEWYIFGHGTSPIYRFKKFKRYLDNILGV